MVKLSWKKTRFRFVCQIKEVKKLAEKFKFKEWIFSEQAGKTIRTLAPQDWISPSNWKGIMYALLKTQSQ